MPQFISDTTGLYIYGALCILHRKHFKAEGEL